MERIAIYFTMALALLTIGCGQHEFAATLYEEPRALNSYTLETTDGETIETGSPEAALTVYFFGYTFCPDFCPTTMLDLRRAYDFLGEEQQKQVDVVMVSVDPERDTLELLADYVSNFNPAFKGYRTNDRAVLDAMVFDFGATYSYTDVSEESAAEYLVNHTTALFFVDENGDLLGIMTYGKSAEEIAADIEALLAQRS